MPSGRVYMPKCCSNTLTCHEDLGPDQTSNEKNQKDVEKVKASKQDEHGHASRCRASPSNRSRAPNRTARMPDGDSFYDPRPPLSPDGYFCSAAEVEMVQIPMAVFRHQMDMMMAKHVRPPTKKDLGKHMRKLKVSSRCRT